MNECTSVAGHLVTSCWTTCWTTVNLGEPREADHVKGRVLEGVMVDGMLLHRLCIILGASWMFVERLPSLFKMWGDKCVTLLFWLHKHDSSGYLYLKAISDHFSTLDFPSSVFLVKMCLVVVVMLASKTLIPCVYVGIQNSLIQYLLGRTPETLSYIGYSS